MIVRWDDVGSVAKPYNYAGGLIHIPGCNRTIVQAKNGTIYYQPDEKYIVRIYNGR